MSIEHTPPHTSAAEGQQPLSAAEKLALSRQALQAALYPPAKPKKPGVVNSLRKLWPIKRKATTQPAAPVAVAEPATARQPVAAKLAGQADGNVAAPQVGAKTKTAQGAASAAVDQPSSLRQAILGVFEKIGGLLGAVVQSRWHKHPAHFALQVGEPLLQTEIRKRSVPWLAAAAAAGAAVVLLHPWRWKQSRRMVGSVLGKEVRVLASSGLVVLAATALNEWLQRSYSDKGR